MSDALYSTRLRWDSRHGVAKLHGQVVVLHQAPDLGGGPVHGCDYVPEVRMAEIQPRACDSRRDMTAREIEAADRVLAELVESGSVASR
jgi:hypothetical protein